MRILIIHNYYNSRVNSGENTVVNNEMKLLSEAGHHVTLFSKQNEPDNKMNLSERIKIGIEFSTGQGSSEELKTLLDGHEFDVCHVHNIFPLIGSDIFPIISDAGIPIVQTLHNFRYRCGSGVNSRNGIACFDCSKKIGSLPLIAHRCYRNSYIESLGMFFAQREYLNMMKYISVFIVLSPFSRDSLLQFGIPSSRIRFKPNFTFRSSTDGILRSKVVLYSGRLEAEKGVTKLMEAWDKSSASDAGWTLKIAGSGSLNTKVQDYANNAKKVIYLGQLSHHNLLNEIKSASFSLITSQALENCPMSILESLSVGTPLISSSNPSIQSFLKSSFNKMLPEDADNWFLTFNDLSNLNCELMSKNAIEEYEAKYSPESSLSILETIYSEFKSLK